MKFAAALVALIAPLALAAPALAKPSPNADKLTAHMESLDTAKATACMGEDQSADQLIANCQAAIDELQATRKTSPRASAGEKANFDFLESVLQSGLAAGYAKVDQAASARVCTTFERVWTLRYGLVSVPESELSAEAFAAFKDVPKEIGPILDICRKSFGTPKDGAPRPAD